MGKLFSPKGIFEHSNFTIYIFTIIITTMNYFRIIKNLLISLILSPVIIYIILGIAKAFGATYTMEHGDTFIIWLLMAILIKNCLPK